MATRHSTVSVGKRFGRLVVQREGERRERRGHRRWYCRCDCGAEKLIRIDHLSTGRVISCGCRLREVRAERGRNSTTHGYARHGRVTREYQTWQRIIGRCHNPTNKAYADYGGRGIVVCERWRDSFEAFLEDMGPRPSASHSIDRIDNDGGYEPGNCRWATRSQQGRNKRSNRRLTFNGRTMCVAEWAEEFGINRDVLYKRLSQLKWSVEKSLTTPARKTT